MALPSIGTLSLSEIATEYSVTQSNVSLATMSVDISLTAPHAVSEFYGRSAGPSFTPLSYTEVAQGSAMETWRVFYNNGRWHITGQDSDGEYDISDNNASSFTNLSNSIRLNGSLAFNGDTVCAIDLSADNDDFRIFRSTNNGTSYSTVFTDTNGNYTNTRVGPHIFYHGNNRWIAFSNYTNYLSTDNGQTWTIKYGPGVGQFGGGAQSGSRIIVNDNDNFYVSDQGFGGYNVISLPYVSGSKYIPNNIAHDGNGTWLAWRYYPAGRMLKSTNNGTTWSAISTDLPAYSNGISLKYQQGTYGDNQFHIVACSTSFINKAGGVFSSSNDGSNFDFTELVGGNFQKGASGIHHNGTDMVAGHLFTHYKFN